jgi:hypothetical protein
MRIVACLIAAVIGLGPAGVVRSQDAPPTPVEAWPLEKVQRLGQALYDQDIAAARGTDALLARFSGQPPSDLAGWIVVGEGRNQTVRFLAREGDGFRAAWDIPVRNGRAGAVVEVTDTALPPEQLAMFRARTTAASNIGALRCTPRYNAVVLNDPDSDGWLVWLLASTNQSNQLIVTGHYRFRISADGTEVLRRDQLSATCIIQTADPAQGQLAGLTVSHIVSPQPVETHVFTSLLYRLPVFVVAGDKLYGVEGARIREVRR